MNILLVTMEMEIGGAETHIFELAQELNNRGNKVIVMSAGGKFAERLIQDGIKHIYAPLKNKKPQNMIKSYEIIKKTIKEEKINIVHAHARIPAFISGIACKRLKVPFVTTSHGVYKVTPLLKVLTNWGQKTLAVSEDIKKQIVKDYKIAPENISITVNGINTNSFKKSEADKEIIKELNLDKNKFKIIHVSRLDKDSSDVAEMLIKSSNILNNQISGGVQLIIVGTGNRIQELKKLKEIYPNVIMTGLRTDVERILTCADVFVGVSRAALEAMAEEIPVILAGNPNYQQGYMGIFDESKLKKAIDTNFCCRDEEELKSENVIRDLVEIKSMDEEKKESLGKFSRKVVEDYYSISKMVSDAEKLYREVM